MDNLHQKKPLEYNEDSSLDHVGAHIRHHYENLYAVTIQGDEEDNQDYSNPYGSINEALLL